MSVSSKSQLTDIQCFSCVVQSFSECMEELKTSSITGYSLEYFCRKWEKSSKVYQYRKLAGFLEHHESCHTDEPIRLYCRKCVALFDQPGLAERHAKQNSVARSSDQQSYFCSQCANTTFTSMELLRKHANNKHDVTFCRTIYDYEDFLVLGTARRVRPCLWKQKQDNSIRLWTWSGVVFTPLAGCSVQKLAFGCNYIPEWPYQESYSCGICKKLSKQRKDIVLHLKFKHSITSPDKRIETGPGKDKKEKEKEEGSLLCEVAESETAEDDGSSDSDVAYRHRFRSRSGRYTLRYCNKVFQCRKCSKTFDSAVGAFQHDDKCHYLMTNDADRFPHKLEDFCCSFCASRFSMVNSVQQHERKVHPEHKSYESEVVQLNDAEKITLKHKKQQEKTVINTINNIWTKYNK